MSNKAPFDPDLSAGFVPKLNAGAVVLSLGAVLSSADLLTEPKGDALFSASEPNLNVDAVPGCLLSNVVEPSDSVFPPLSAANLL